jgi:hypothetical protein
MIGLVVAFALAQLDGGAVVDVVDPSPVVEPAPVEPVPVAAGDAPRVDALTPVDQATSVGTPPPETRAPGAGFIKGELSVYLGSDRLVVKNNRIGVSAGLDRFETAYYLLVEPLVDLRFLDEGKLGIGLGVPLRLELVNLANDSMGMPILTSRLGRLRVEDYDSVHDFGRVLKYVTFGRKEDPLYISAGQRYASSIGHGALVRRYAPNIDIDYPRASAQVDAYNRFGGFEFFTNDLLEWNTLAAIAFIKPLSFLQSENLLAQSLSIGVSGATDWKAPYTLNTDPITGLRLLDAQGRLQAQARPVVLLGVDAEVKVVKTRNVDLKPYVDYSMLLGGDGGLTVGLLGRFNVGTDVVNAFRVVAELRLLGNRYQPSYFDTFYEIERFIFTSEPGANPNVRNAITRQQYVLERGLGNRVGYYAEASWGIPGKVGLTLAVEGVSNAPNTNLIAHLELPVLDFLQVFGSYYKRGITSAAAIFRIDPLIPDTVFYAGARLKLLPFLFINGRAYQTFRLNPDVKRYDNQLGFVVDVEIGYEFKAKKSETVATTPPETAPVEAGPVSDQSSK